MPGIQRPNQPVAIVHRLALHDERVTADLQRVALGRRRDLRKPHVEHRRRRMDAGIAEADDLVGTPSDNPHGERAAAGRRVYGIRRHIRVGE
ncbi:MAG: hypothetical protein IPM60_15585 [Rhodospirillales bacterium]|nr:hypothetical protein [Rhodospirillales bacterium]